MSLLERKYHGMNCLRVRDITNDGETSAERLKITKCRYYGRVTVRLVSGRFNGKGKTAAESE